MEKLKDSQNSPFQIILDHFGRKILEKLQNSQIGHSESIWTTWVGKYLKSCKMAKIGHSESIWTTSVGKYWKSCKTAYSLGHQTGALGTDSWPLNIQAVSLLVNFCP